MEKAKFSDAEFEGVKQFTIVKKGEVTLKPFSNNKDRVIFGADRSCYGDNQFRVCVLNDNRVAIQFTDVNAFGATTRPGNPYENQEQTSYDGNGYFYQATTVKPLIINEWNTLNIIKSGDLMTIELNGFKNVVKMNQEPDMKPIVPFRVGGRYPPGSGDSYENPFDGEIIEVTVEFI